MSKMVTARVPDALYEQGCIQLKQLGAGTTDLVKAAFDYVLKEHALPSAQSAKRQGKQRKLPAKDRARLDKLFSECCADIGLSSQVSEDKKAIREARAGKHESLA